MSEVYRNMVMVGTCIRLCYEDLTRVQIGYHHIRNRNWVSIFILNKSGYRESGCFVDLYLYASVVDAGWNASGSGFQQSAIQIAYVKRADPFNSNCLKCDRCQHT